MSLNPIVALDHVLAEYRDYLRSEFRARDQGLKDALDRELAREGFLAQEPFYQAHRPLKPGARWRDLPLDARLAAALKQRSGNDYSYSHQSESIQHLLSPNASPLVVTTGTGSGKTECFLAPVIQNAIEDAARFNRSGLTAILVYPMNALANDQLDRIEEYLASPGAANVVVRKYDRGTKQTEREEMRRNPPHILLTNYMMLEYLLVRPADRDALFANHRCRFLVLDEVHTYRGALGSNVALLVRRLRAHLARARQDWATDVPPADDARRRPTLIPIATSATIKSVIEEGLSRAEIIRHRDAAVQDFFGRLAGVPPESIKVCGEELAELSPPAGATLAEVPVTDLTLNVADGESVRRALCRAAGIAEAAPLSEATQRARLLWLLNQWLIHAPMSLSQIAARVKREVPERVNADEAAIRREVELVLLAGAALPEGTPGALRLRVHRFIRGGWKIHRCVSPSCGRIYPMGEERCACGHATAPLYLCRACGADYLRFTGDPEQGALQPSNLPAEDREWLLYDHVRLEPVAADDEADGDENGETGGRRRAPRERTQVRGERIRCGSFDVRTLTFSEVETDYPLRVMLTGKRTRCLCCGGTAGSRNVLTPVALGTSAAVKVLSEGLVESLAEANADKPGHDGKERLLVFSDSRQDAAHQARFVIFASRYDRFRRRLVQLLHQHAELSLQRIVELLAEMAVSERDNPNVVSDGWIPDEERERIRAWEEAPLLDEIAVNAAFRSTVVNLGVVQVGYSRLVECVRAHGDQLAQLLGVNVEALAHVCRSLLDELRVRRCLSRDMLRYHPKHPSYPRYFERADWERKVKQPLGLATGPDGPGGLDGKPIAFLDQAAVPSGISIRNPWRRTGAGGRGPGPEKIFKHLMRRFGGHEAQVNGLIAVLEFLKENRFLTLSELFGATQKAKFLQVNAEVVRLKLTTAETRFRCNVCSTPLSGASDDAPCPRCDGRATPWPDAEVDQHRAVRRLRAEATVPLYAAEHTAQVPGDVRTELEDDFKGPPSRSKINLLACSRAHLSFLEA